MDEANANNNMIDARWKFGQPEIMEDATTLAYAITSWKFGQLVMLVNAVAIQQTATFTIDAFIAERKIATFTLDSLIAERKSATFTLDAYIANKATFTLDSLIAERKVATFTLDAYIASKATCTLDAYIATKATVTIDAYITTKATVTIEAEIQGEGIRFLYQVIEEQLSGIHTITLSKTTDGPPISKAIWIPPSNIRWFLALSYDGTNFAQDIEIMPHTPYRLSGVARAIRVTIP